MKQLPNVTLLAVDCFDLKRSQLAADISAKEIEFGAVKILSSIPSDDKRVVRIPKIHSVRGYSEFMVKRVYEYVDTEFVLIFQYDGFVLNPQAWSDDFLKYDYIGAPWAHLGKLVVGNGGFSLRSKKLLLWLGHHWREVSARINPEDVFISNFARPYLEKAGMRFAPEDVAARFSKEGNRHSVVWNGEFGFHGARYTDISRWLDKHPEYRSRLTYELDDYTTLMEKYPVYDGTIHTFDFGKRDMKGYIALSKGKKSYEVRQTVGRYDDLNDVKIGDTIVFKRSGVSFESVPVPAFERKIKNIERFSSLSVLKKKYPKLKITFPWKNVAHWKRPFVRLFGDLALPKDEGYSVFWF